jgi:hypothetical protein
MRKSARSFFKQPKPPIMFGLFKTNRKPDLLLLSEALAETRSELHKVREELETLQREFVELEIPEELDEYELSDKIDRQIRENAWDYIESEVERVLADYTTTEDLQYEFEHFATKFDNNFAEAMTKDQARAELARLTAFVFALVDELGLTHKVTELEERSNEIVLTLLAEDDEV